MEEEGGGGGRLGGFSESLPVILETVPNCFCLLVVGGGGGAGGRGC